MPLAILIVAQPSDRSSAYSTWDSLRVVGVEGERPYESPFLLFICEHQTDLCFKKTNF